MNLTLIFTGVAFALFIATSGFAWVYFFYCVYQHYSFYSFFSRSEFFSLAPSLDVCQCFLLGIGGCRDSRNSNIRYL